MQVFAPRIGFEFGLDEPYHDVEEGLDKPIYYVWNQYDASNSAYLQFENLDKAIDLYNPGSNSITNMVCIANPDSPPGPTCNLHVPSAYDYPETQTLVEQIYYWALGLLINRADFDHEVYLPNLLKY